MGGEEGGKCGWVGAEWGSGPVNRIVYTASFCMVCFQNSIGIDWYNGEGD